MQPIGPLMHEHRLIERMVNLILKQAESADRGGEPDPAFVSEAVDFFRVYADRCHHGKEEDLLFQALRAKNLTDDLSRIMEELIQEHRQGRDMVGKLEQANQAFVANGRGAREVADLLKSLADFYPRHIAKEDKHFFFPVMDYFDRGEMDRMLADFYEFDRRLIHDFFRAKVETWEEGS